MNWPPGVDSSVVELKAKVLCFSWSESHLVISTSFLPSCSLLPLSSLLVWHILWFLGTNWNSQFHREESWGHREALFDPNTPTQQIQLETHGKTNEWSLNLGTETWETWVHSSSGSERLWEATPTDMTPPLSTQTKCIYLYSVWFGSWFGFKTTTEATRSTIGPKQTSHRREAELQCLYVQITG